MPSNIIQINGDEKMTWIIPDSKMEEIIKKLDEFGDKEMLFLLMFLHCLIHKESPNFNFGN